MEEQVERMRQAAPPRAESAESRAILEALDRIERRLDRVEALVQAGRRGATDAVAVAVDTFDGWMAGLSERGVDVDARARSALEAVEHLTSGRAVAMVGALLDRAESIEALLGSGVLDPAAVRVVAAAGQALAEAAEETGRPLGPFAAMRALREPDVRAATGFLVRFARRLGRALASDADAERALPAETSSSSS